MGGGGGAGFEVSGVLAQTAAGKSGGGQGAEKTVTHIMAVTPSSQNTQRIIAPVSSDGHFKLTLDPARPWVLVFVDANRVGKDMIAGVFKADVLDTLTPAAEGKADLGAVSVSDGKATSGIAYSDLLRALGLDARTAGLIGAMDDLCLRYVNPDIDGDGVLDATQPDHGALLDFHVGFALAQAGHSLTVADIVGAFPDAAATVTYGGTGIYASFPASFYGGDLATTASVTFAEPIHVSTFGPGGHVQEFAAGTPIGGADLILGLYGDYRSLGVFATPGYDMPQGEYVFDLGPTTLTFTEVRTRSDAELVAGEDLLMPFLRIVPTDSACVSGCAIGAIDYKWMKRTAAGWIDATLPEITLVVADQGGYISIVKAHDNGDQHIGFLLPIGAIAGTIPWAAAGANLAGLTAAEMAATTTDELCHFGLSYDDKLGMRMFGSIGNAPGTCENL
jgi:hypothetical protein